MTCGFGLLGGKWNEMKMLIKLIWEFGVNFCIWFFLLKFRKLARSAWFTIVKQFRRREVSPSISTFRSFEKKLSRLNLSKRWLKSLSPRLENLITFPLTWSSHKSQFTRLVTSSFALKDSNSTQLTWLRCRRKFRKQILVSAKGKHKSFVTEAVCGKKKSEKKVRYRQEDEDLLSVGDKRWGMRFNV